MTTLNHTAGPWQRDGQFIVAPDPNGKYPDIYIAEIVETDDEGRIAPPEQQKANGDLIAAAPALFHALDLCEEVLLESARLDDGTPSISALHLARDALTKAKGGRP